MREDWCQTHVKRIGSYRYKLFSLALHKDWKRGKEAALFTSMSQKKRKYFPKCRTVALKLVLYWKGCKINHNFGFKFQLSNQTLVNSFSIIVLFRQPGHKQLNFVHWCLMSGSTSLCVCVCVILYYLSWISPLSIPFRIICVSCSPHERGDRFFAIREGSTPLGLFFLFYPSVQCKIRYHRWGIFYVALLRREWFLGNVAIFILWNTVACVSLLVAHFSL